METIMHLFAILMAAGYSSRYKTADGSCQNKLLVPFRGKPLITYTLDLLGSMDCFERIILVYADEKIKEISSGVCQALPFSMRKMRKNTVFERFLPCKLPKEPVNRGILRLFTAKFHKSDRLLGRIICVYNAYPQKGQGESARLGVAAAGKVLAGTGIAGPQAIPVPASDAYFFFFPCDQPLLDARTIHLMLAAAKPGFIVEPCHTGNASAPGNCERSPNLFSASFYHELLALKPGELPRQIKARHSQLVIQAEVNTPNVLADIDTCEDLARLENEA